MVKNILNYEGVIAQFYEEYMERRDYYKSKNYEYQDVYYDIFGPGDDCLPYLYYAEAEEALLEVGIFEVLGDIQAFQMEESREIYVDLSNSCEIAGAYFTMLAHEVFIAGYRPVGNFFIEIMDKFLNDEDDEQLEALLEAELEYLGRDSYE